MADTPMIVLPERATAWAFDAIQRLGCDGEVGVFRSVGQGGQLRLVSARGIPRTGRLLDLPPAWAESCRTGMPYWGEGTTSLVVAAIPLVARTGGIGLLVLYRDPASSVPLTSRKKAALRRICDRLALALTPGETRILGTAERPDSSPGVSLDDDRGGWELRRTGTEGWE